MSDAIAAVAPAQVDSIVRLLAQRVHESLQKRSDIDSDRQREKDDEQHTNNSNVHRESKSPSKDSDKDDSKQKRDDTLFASEMTAQLLEDARHWPRTHPRFHKLELAESVSEFSASPVDRAQFEHQLQQQTERMVQQLEHIRDPNANPLPVENNSTLSTASQKSKPSSSSSYQSLFSPLPSYESIDSYCDRARNTRLSIQERYQSLCNLLEMHAGDLVSSPQWQNVLAAVGSCAISPFGPQSSSSSSSASGNHAAPSKPHDDKKHTSFSHKRKQQHPPQHPSQSKKEPYNQEADIHERFRLSAKAIDALRELYENTEEGSSQRGEIALALMQALKNCVNVIVPAAYSSSSSSGSNLQWLGAIPTELNSASLSQYSPLVLSNTILFHLCRILTHILHSIPNAWVYFNREMIDDLMDAIVQLMAAFHATSSPSTSTPSSSSSSLSPPTVWCLFSMCDTRFTWLRRWVSQPATRSAWHNACIKRRQGFLKALDECWKMVKEFPVFNSTQLQISSSIDSSNNNSSTQSKAPLLTLNSLECSALASTSSWAFLVEHLLSLISRTPSSAASPTSANNPLPSAGSPIPSHSSSSNSNSKARDAVASSTSQKQHRSLSHKNKRNSSNSKDSLASSTKPSQVKENTASGKMDEFSFYLHQLHLRSLCMEFASISITFYALNTLPDLSTPASAATSSTPKQPLVQRLRLTLISMSVHLLCTMLPTASFIEQSSQSLQTLCATIEAVFEPTSPIALSLYTQNMSYMDPSRLAGNSNSTSNNLAIPASKGGMSKSRSQQDLKGVGAASNASGSPSASTVSSAASSQKKKKGTTPTMKVKTLPQSSSVIVTGSSHNDTVTLSSVAENTTTTATSNTICPTQQCAITSILGVFQSFMHASVNSPRCKFILAQQISLSIFLPVAATTTTMSPTNTHSGAFNFSKSSNSSAASSGRTSPTEPSSKAVSTSGTQHHLLQLLVRWLKPEFETHDPSDQFGNSPLSTPTAASSGSMFLSVPSAPSSVHSSPAVPKRKRIGFGFTLDPPTAASSTSASPASSVPTTARFSESIATPALTHPSTPAASLRLLHPTIKWLMVDLLKDCISLTPPNALSALNADLQALASKIVSLVQSLPPEDAESNSSPKSSSKASKSSIELDSEDELPRHQQSEQITSLLDLWMHWCATSNSFDQLSNPTVLQLAARRFTHQVRQFSPRSRSNTVRSESITICLPWCSACQMEHEKSLSIHAHIADYSLVHYERFHRTLLTLLQSEAGLIALVRAGFVKLLLTNLSRRLQEEDEEWSLSLELDEENTEPHDHLWSYRMLRSVFSSVACLQMMKREINLLSDASLQVSNLPSYPEAPLFFVMSNLLHSWLLLLDFEDEVGDEEVGKNSNKKRSNNIRAGFIPVPIKLPLELPIRFQAASAVSQPVEWLSSKLVSTNVASLMDTREIALRILCGCVASPSAGSGFADLFVRSWNLKSHLLTQYGEHSDEIEDQCTKWARFIISKIA